MGPLKISQGLYVVLDHTLRSATVDRVTSPCHASFQNQDSMYNATTLSPFPLAESSHLLTSLSSGFSLRVYKHQGSGISELSKILHCNLLVCHK